MYLTAAEYEQLTARDQLDASEARIRRASMLLDARLGNWRVNADGWKLNLATLPLNQVSAVKEWTAQMIAFLADNSDLPPSSATLSLGRFSVTEHGQKERILPEALLFADSLVVSCGLIRRGVVVI